MRPKVAAVLGMWLVWLIGGGCASHRLPPPPAGLSFKPGNFVKEYFFAPGFAPAQVSYALEPFTVEQAQGVAPETFVALLRTELTRAWEDNGLKLSAKKPGCRLALTIHQVRVDTGSLRFLRGKISAHLAASGTITQDDRLLFAFRDRLSLNSPVSLGPPAPKESELLLKEISRELVHRLLNELLLHGLTADARDRSANTLTSSRGRF
jgi:hypothetical protein